jgi:WD40 repeat protein
MKMHALLFASCALTLLPQISSGQQTTGSSACSLVEPALRTSRPNIFSDQQEQWLGDAQASEEEPYFNLLPQEDSAELGRIGQKLLAQLPPTPIHFQFRVYESDEANAFSLAGGYVYVSRKLITDARSEDEVAGVLSHEIGHIYTKQIASDFTRELKARMNVTSVGDRDDLNDKLQLLLNVPWKASAGESGDEAERDELLADRVGMYALSKAGYAPRAFSENLDRIAANKGHTGNFLTDILGATSEISLRVRIARKISAALPQACGSLEPSSSPEFKAFQESIRSATIHTLIAPSPNLTSYKLQQPMRPDFDQVRFSPNGNYILAQTESSIDVLTRSPLKLLFTIDARRAQLAHFTPDSSHIVFHYPTMRVESWDIASQKRESYHELVDYDGCQQSSLSPDGKTFVCVSLNQDSVWLKLTDVETGKRLFEDKAFYLGMVLGQSQIVVRKGAGVRIATVVYSQDGRTMLIVAGAKVLAYDLVAHKRVSLGGSLAHLEDGRIAFVDSSNLVFECDKDQTSGAASDTFQLCEATFPDGRPIDSFKIGYQWIEPVASGNYVLIGPFKDGAAMLAVPSTGKAVARFKLDSLDIYGDTMASENESGGLTVSKIGGQNAESVDLPPSPETSVEAAAFSPDGRFLAYSTRFRSSIWDLKMQKRVALMRPFRGVRFDTGEQMYAQYLQAGQHPGLNYHIDLTTGKAVNGAPYAIDQFQRGDVLVTIQPRDKSGDVTSNIDLQVADMMTGAQLWSKRFAHDTPIVRETENGTILLQITLDTDTAVNEIKHASGKLVKSSDWKSEWLSPGLLIQAVDSHTGEIRREVQVPERWAYWNGDDVRTGALYGDYLIVRGIYNNSVIYRLSDGKRLGAFFGRVIAGDGKLGLIAATNRDQEIILYDANNGKELKRATLDQLPQAARIIPSENALLVLTASQTIYTIGLPTPTQAEIASSK